MKENLKYFIKKNFPVSIIEFFSSKKVWITKAPERKSVVSDLFIFRINGNWETHFELLNIQHVMSPGDKTTTSNKAIVFFFNKDGELINNKEVETSVEMKKSININKLAKDLKIEEDGLFSVFHYQPPEWFQKHNSFLAERGYTGYINPQKGKIKSFVHGNLDSISLNQNNKTKLLGEVSFKQKEYHLQHLLEDDKMYELFIINPSNKPVTVKVIEKKEFMILKEEKLILPAGGFRKFVKSIYNSNSYSRIIIKSKLYLARPVVFKHMESSFDVFHG